MIYLTHALLFFALGFSCALLLILRVSMRPKVKTILKKAGVLKMHKARVPKGRIEEDVFVEDEARFI